MKLAILSDIHFGDDQCTLVNKDLTIGNRYVAFSEAVGQNNDYLVLVGDIFDFSIASYDDAYKAGKVFFQQIKNNNIAREIIYLPGNHDADIWHIVQHQKSVINKMINGKDLEPFEHSIAGIIDDRNGAVERKLILDKTTVKTGGPTKYGGLFLDHIIHPDTITFNIAYPNLYIVTDKESVLVTHGQYLESYWSLLGELAMEVAYDDLKVGEVDIEEMMELNFPLNQIACTGLGQAGVLTKVVRQVQIEVKRCKTKRLRKYLDRAEKVVDKMTNFDFVKEIFCDFIAKKAKEQILEALENTEATRFSQEFVYKKDVQERFRRYYQSSLLELGDINSRLSINLPAPWKIIFGHTHQPIAWNSSDAPKIDSVSSASPKRLTLHNMGGWLEDEGKFCGAEIFLYETGNGFSSVHIP